MTVEISTRTSPTGTASRNRTRNFFRTVLVSLRRLAKAFVYTSPILLLREAKSPSGANGWAFRFIGAATWQRHCGNTRKFCTAVSVAPQRFGEHIDQRFLAVDRILLIFPATSQFINQQQL